MTTRSRKLHTWSTSCLAHRPDVREAMIRSGSRLIVMAHDEFTTDVPEHSKLAPKDYWDARARGLGGSETDPVCSCAEENLLGLAGDPYSTECILIHEFAHNIHLRGMASVDPTFDKRLRAAYERATQAGRWRGFYAGVNHHEYFAEGVQSWFGNNRENDQEHNHVNTREELIAYDPGLAALCGEIFGNTRLVYTKPADALRDHLAGYDPSKAPRFEWPERLQAAREKIQAEAATKCGSHQGVTAGCTGPGCKTRLVARVDSSHLAPRDASRGARRLQCWRQARRRLATVFRRGARRRSIE